MAGVTLFFMSDSYLGLDQQYFVPVPDKQQNRHMSPSNGVHQSQAAKMEDANTASTYHSLSNDDRDAEDVSKAVSQTRLDEGQDGAVNAAVEHEAKGQRSNARRQRR